MALIGKLDQIPNSFSASLRLRGEKFFYRNHSQNHPKYAASYVIGSAITASQPVRSRRLESCRTPPWASAIWRLRISPIPLPPCLVVKKGTKRLSLLSRPGPWSRMKISTLRALVRQPTSTEPGCLSEGSSEASKLKIKNHTVESYRQDRKDK